MLTNISCIKCTEYQFISIDWLRLRVRVCAFSTPTGATCGKVPAFLWSTCWTMPYTPLQQQTSHPFTRWLLPPRPSSTAYATAQRPWEYRSWAWSTEATSVSCSAPQSTTALSRSLVPDTRGQTAPSPKSRWLTGRTSSGRGQSVSTTLSPV